MKLNLESSRDTLIECVKLCDTLDELNAALKFVDKIMSIQQFPSEGATRRLDALMEILNVVHNKSESFLITKQIV
jgi:hypothetical protein